MLEIECFLFDAEIGLSCDSMRSSIGANPTVIQKVLLSPSIQFHPFSEALPTQTWRYPIVGHIAPSFLVMD